MKSVAGICLHIIPPDQDHTEANSRKWLKEPKESSSMKKSKKLQQEIRNHEIS